MKSKISFNGPNSISVVMGLDTYKSDWRPKSPSTCPLSHAHTESVFKSYQTQTNSHVSREQGRPLLYRGPRLFFFFGPIIYIYILKIKFLLNKYIQHYIKIYRKFILQAFLDKKSIIKLLKSICYSIYFSIYSITNPFNLSCDIVDRMYDLINFNFEKLLYVEATVTGIVNSIL